MGQISLQLADRKKAYFEGNTYQFKDMIRAIPGAAWNPKKDFKRWEVPIESVQDALRIMPTLNLSDEVKNLFMAKKSMMQTAIDVKNRPAPEASRTVPGLKGKLYPYQAVGKEFLMTMEKGEGGVLAFAMGLGKSLTSLATCLEWKHRGLIDHVLVVCPSPLKYSVWAKEVKKWTNMEAMVIDGDTSEVVEWDDGTKERLTGRALREVQYQQWAYGADVLIMNYELFLQDAEAIKWEKVRVLSDKEAAMYHKLATDLNRQEGRKDDAPKGYEAASGRLTPNFVSHPKEYAIKGKKEPYLAHKTIMPNIIPEMTDRWAVVMDESHRIKNPKSQTTKNIMKLLEPAGFKILGSGTPLENNVQEIWSTVDFCRKGLLGNYYKFMDRYIEMDFFGKPIAPKPQMMPELKERIDPVMIRKTKEEAMPDLPPLTVEEYWVDMTPEQKRVYKMVSEGILQIADTDNFTYLEVLAQITRLQQVCDSPALLREVMENPNLPEESGKLKELAHIIEDLNPNENKFILFSQYKEMTDILYKWLIDNKVLRKDQVGYVYGGVGARKTEEIRVGFQEGNIQCVLMTTAGNYGLDLYEATYVICYDQLFNPQKMDQIYSRAHRNGAKKPITAINMVTKDTYEERRLDILTRKKELFKAVIDNDAEMASKLFMTPQDLKDLI